MASTLSAYDPGPITFSGGLDFGSRTVGTQSTQSLYLTASPGSNSTAQIQVLGVAFGSPFAYLFDDGSGLMGTPSSTHYAGIVYFTPSAATTYSSDVYVTYRMLINGTTWTQTYQRVIPGALTGTGLAAPDPGDDDPPLSFDEPTPVAGAGLTDRWNQTVRYVGDDWEVGNIRFKQDGWWDWPTVVYHNEYVDPVVVAGPVALTSLNNKPGHVRLKGVPGSKFSIQVEEWEYQNGKKPDSLNMRYLAMERGVGQRGDFLVEANKVSGVTNTWVSVTFAAAFQVPPIVLTTLATHEGGDSAIARIRNVTAQGFELRLQEEEARGGHMGEEVCWVAIEPGSGSFDGQFIAHVRLMGIDQGATTLTEITLDEFGYGLLGMVQTTNEIDPVDVRYQWFSDKVNLYIQEEQSADTEIDHAPEAVGFLMIGDPLLAN